MNNEENQEIIESTITVTHTANENGNYATGVNSFIFTVTDTTAPIVSIEKSDYNTFNWKIIKNFIIKKMKN